MKKKFAAAWLVLVILMIFGAVEHEIWSYWGVRAWWIFHAIMVGCAVTIWAANTVFFVEGEKPEDTW